jgi:hypothetical protein
MTKEEDLKQKYNPYIDDFLNDIMDRRVELELNEHTANIGDVRIWISNYPYNYGSIYEHEPHIAGRPSLAVITAFREYELELRQLNDKFIQLTEEEELLESYKLAEEYLNLDAIACKMLVEK